MSQAERVISRKLLRTLAWLGTLLIVVLLANEVVARGRGGLRRGGGGFSRGGGGLSRAGGVGGGYGAGRPASDISRRGPSSSGTFGRGRSYGGRPDGDVDRPQNRSSRSGDPPDTGDLPYRGDRDTRQDARKDRYDDRAADRDDRRKQAQEQVDQNTYTQDEYYEDRHDLAVGAYLSSARFHAQTCTVTSVVNSGVTYYQCGSTWYNRSYSGGSVNYIVVKAPPGY